MRDLKHLIRFEELLRAANNELVKQACAEGKLALGYNCSYIPEVLLDVEGCCGLRLRAPGCTSPDMATYYMTNRHVRTPRAYSSAPSRAATTSWMRSSARNAAAR